MSLRVPLSNPKYRRNFFDACFNFFGLVFRDFLCATMRFVLVGSVLCRLKAPIFAAFTASECSLGRKFSACFRLTRCALLHHLVLLWCCCRLKFTCVLAVPKRRSCPATGTRYVLFCLKPFLFSFSTKSQTDRQPRVHQHSLEGLESRGRPSHFW